MWDEKYFQMFLLIRKKYSICFCQNSDDMSVTFQCHSSLVSALTILSVKEYVSKTQSSFVTTIFLEN